MSGRATRPRAVTDPCCFQDELRLKFVEKCKAYLGVPYSRKTVADLVACEAGCAAVLLLAPPLRSVPRAQSRLHCPSLRG
jgi:hypothetical protein